MLVQFPDGSWGVIDSNRDSSSSEPAALTFLRKAKVEELAFVCLTHPHADHYSGLSDILRFYEGRIEELWMFQLDSTHWKKFLVVQQHAATAEPRRRKFEELCTIFRHVKEFLRSNRLRLMQANVSLPDRGGVSIDCLAPHPKQLGPYQQALAKSFDQPKSYRADENVLSVVLRLRYGNAAVILGADTPKASWLEMYREAKKRRQNFQPELTKVSHHGSLDGFHSEIWKQMIRPGLTHAAVSAGPAYGHPDKDVIVSLSEMKARLHCTNYPSYCLKNSHKDLSKFQNLSERLRMTLFMLDQTSNAPLVPCNGDLHFSISTNGRVDFNHQYNGFCPLHII